MPNRSNNERTETSNGIDKKVVIFLAILLVVVALGFLYVLTDVVNANTETISNVFVDVNNDGRIDLITTGKVIFNVDKSLNFTIGNGTQ